MDLNGITKSLKITDVIMASVIAAIAAMVIYWAFMKDDRYVQLIDHRNGIVVLQTRNDKLYRMDESDSLINAIKRYAVLENSTDLKFYLINSTLPKERLDSILGGQLPVGFQADLLLEFKRENAVLKLISSKTSRNTKETRNEIVLL